MTQYVFTYASRRLRSLCRPHWTSQWRWQTNWAKFLNLLFPLGRSSPYRNQFTVINSNIRTDWNFYGKSSRTAAAKCRWQAQQFISKCPTNVYQSLLNILKYSEHVSQGMEYIQWMHVPYPQNASIKWPFYMVNTILYIFNHKTTHTHKHSR